MRTTVMDRRMASLPNYQGGLTKSQPLIGCHPQHVMQPMLQQGLARAGASSGRRCSGGTLSSHLRRRHKLIVSATAAAMPLPAGAKSKAESIFSNKYDSEIWSLALPALCGMMLEPILSAINAALVGHLGTQQLGAVSLGSLAISFASFLFSFLLFLTTPMIAEAVVKKDFDKGSKMAAKSFWLAGGFGLTTALSVFFLAPNIIQALRPPEPAVAQYATDYIRVRAPGILASLFQFVAIGTYRGYRDTKTPLYAALGSGIASLSFNLLFIYGLKMGVLGSGLATTLAQYVSCTCLCLLMVRSGKLRLGDLVRPPSVASMIPLLKAGGVLAFRNMIAFGMVLYGSMLCVRGGASYQASFEVIRQVWVLTIQSFECLNVATQTLCAAYLGSQNVAAARAVFGRLLLLGTAIGATAGLVIFALQNPVVGFFTKDPAVVAQVLLTLPMVCAMFPLDAAASIFDGSLLAARQTNYLSYVQIAGSVLQYAGLLYLANHGLVSAFSIWACLKLMTFFRLAGGAWRNFGSRSSAYRLGVSVASAAPAAAAVASPNGGAAAVSAGQQAPAAGQEAVAAASTATSAAATAPLASSSSSEAATSPLAGRQHQLGVQRTGRQASAMSHESVHSGTTNSHQHHVERDVNELLGSHPGNAQATVNGSNGGLRLLGQATGGFDGAAGAPSHGGDEQLGLELPAGVGVQHGRTRG